MILTCKCGAKLEMADNQITTSARDDFYKAHDICLQPEQHFHQHLNLDESFWLNTFAGAAMQGILASNTADTRIECLPAACVAVATALLEEVKKHELL